MADWMMMFAEEKTQDWRHAGTPILRILLSTEPLILSFFSSNLAAVFDFRKKSRRTIPLIMLEMTVAVATPSTVLPMNTTKKTFNPTLIRPDITSAINGILVLPMPLNIAASKL